MFRRPTVGSSKLGRWLLEVSLKWQGAAFRNLAGGKDLAFTLLRGLSPTHSAQPTVKGQVLGQERLAGVGRGSLWGLHGDRAARGVWADTSDNCGLGAFYDRVC